MFECVSSLTASVSLSLTVLNSSKKWFLVISPTSTPPFNDARTDDDEDDAHYSYGRKYDNINRISAGEFA